MNKQDKINVAFVVEKQQRAYLFTIVNSIIKNTSSPLLVHVLTDEENIAYLQTHFQALFQALEVKLYVVEPHFKTRFSKHLEFVTEDHLKTGHVLYYKLLLGKYLACNKCIYLDIDMVVQHDLQMLYQEVVDEQCPFKAFDRPMCRPDINLLMNIYHHTNQINYDYFNSGVFVTNLAYWREHNLLEKFLILLDFTLAQQISNCQDQAILNVIFCKKHNTIDARWNVLGLGWSTSLEEEKLQKGYILHYNGPSKPWLENSPYRKYWLKYYIGYKNKKQKLN